LGKGVKVFFTQRRKVLFGGFEYNARLKPPAESLSVLKSFAALRFCAFALKFK
jgi:hypothetical protein